MKSVACRAGVAGAKPPRRAGSRTITVADHFRPGDLAPLVALMAMADATTVLRVGTNVLGNDYRHPVVLAKELASLDLLSDGRLDVGIGAGWLRADYDTWGVRDGPSWCACVVLSPRVCPS